MLSVKEVDAKLARLRTRSSARDQRMRDVLSVRQGDISKVYPSMFSEDYPKPLVANFIDVAAREAKSGARIKSADEAIKENIRNRKGKLIRSTAAAVAGSTNLKPKDK